MSRLRQIAAGVLSGALMMGVAVADPGACRTEAAVFAWTARMLNVEATAERPQVHWLDRSQLHRVFVNSNQQAYLSWVSKYGEKGAQAVMDRFLAEIEGLYDPQKNHIYVANFLEACHRRAILAHEFTHFFQERYGTEMMAWGAFDIATTRSVREMEAYKIEKLFERTFCVPADDGDPAIP